MTPMKSIRAFCVECSCGNMAEVRRCVIPECPLYPYRLGHRPKAGTDTPDGADDENIGVSPTLDEPEDTDEDGDEDV